jgi:hypothetical protein
MNIGANTLYADTCLQIYTLSLCNTHCFSTATMVVRKRLEGMLYVHCQSCCIQFYVFLLHISRGTCHHIFITELCGQAFSVINFRKL